MALLVCISYGNNDEGDDEINDDTAFAALYLYLKFGKKLDAWEKLSEKRMFENLSREDDLNAIKKLNDLLISKNDVKEIDDLIAIKKLKNLLKSVNDVQEITVV
ncbi:16422_t:CDS:1, partial [Racocetra fulgida]